jgi:hypothetical protein
MIIIGAIFFLGMCWVGWEMYKAPFDDSDPNSPMGT